MDKRYNLKYNENKSIEISDPISSILVFKIPYIELKNKTHNVKIENRFIVYILQQKNMSGKDILYVGKSKNGIDNRPVSHEDKNTEWSYCYVLIKTTGLAGGMHHAFKAILLAMPQGILKSLAPANNSQQPLKWLFI